VSPAGEVDGQYAARDQREADRTHDGGRGRIEREQREHDGNTQGEHGSDVPCETDGSGGELSAAEKTGKLVP
jgi:hypothetical protein